MNVKDCRMAERFDMTRAALEELNKGDLFSDSECPGTPSLLPRAPAAPVAT